MFAILLSVITHFPHFSSSITFDFRVLDGGGGLRKRGRISWRRVDWRCRNWQIVGAHQSVQFATNVLHFRLTKKRLDVS